MYKINWKGDYRPLEERMYYLTTLGNEDDFYTAIELGKYYAAIYYFNGGGWTANGRAALRKMENTDSCVRTMFYYDNELEVEFDYSDLLKVEDNIDSIDLPEVDKVLLKNYLDYLENR